MLTFHHSRQYYLPSHELEKLLLPQLHQMQPFLANTSLYLYPEKHLPLCNTSAQLFFEGDPRLPQLTALPIHMLSHSPFLFLSLHNNNPLIKPYCLLAYHFFRLTILSIQKISFHQPLHLHQIYIIIPISDKPVPLPLHF